jgi:hypothetical protein
MVETRTSPAGDQSAGDLPEAVAMPNVADLRTSLKSIEALKVASLGNEFEFEALM